jgi:hypothetical protein
MKSKARLGVKRESLPYRTKLSELLDAAVDTGSLDNIEYAAECYTTARLRDVAAAQGDSAEWITWESMAESAEFEMLRGGAYPPEDWLTQALYYRGLLSLCEAE